ncbi:MAG: hypothetical protein WCD70_13295 [Alphaproteobacteria bacterium]
MMAEIDDKKSDFLEAAYSDKDENKSLVNKIFVFKRAHFAAARSAHSVAGIPLDKGIRDAWFAVDNAIVRCKQVRTPHPSTIMTAVKDPALLNGLVSNVTEADQALKAASARYVQTVIEAEPKNAELCARGQKFLSELGAPTIPGSPNARQQPPALAAGG